MYNVQISSLCVTAAIEDPQGAPNLREVPVEMYGRMDNCSLPSLSVCSCTSFLDLESREICHACHLDS